MKEIAFIFSFKVAPENEEAYQKMLAETLKITKNETGTLMYEVFKDENSLYCQYERYADEEAVMQHVQRTHIQLQQWFELTEIQQIITLGNISNTLKEQFDLKEIYVPFKRVDK